jgi:site-specific DNA recombinase
MYDYGDELDISRLKYALYARKSTDDPQRQVRSIDDQIAECRQFARNKGIKIVEPILIEKKSAKKPGARPIFAQLLKGLKDGKYDGILAWHPDRLARNMKEGGEVIDMIDEGVIKDLKFVTHHFTPDANGKMLLGMSFVLSKQYSDDLAQKVTRGMRRGFAEGKSSGAPKHGYLRTEEGLYRPDGGNFELMEDAWRMRAEGMGIREIVKWLTEKDYGRAVKGLKARKAGKVIRMTIQTLSDVFKDPIYYGILIQANQQVDLRTIYDFKPMVTEEEYNNVQLLSRRRATPMSTKRGAFYPLRGMVKCAFCASTMYAAASKGHDKAYLYYRCDTKDCGRKKRSIRAKIIFNFIDAILGDGLNLGEKEYQEYRSYMRAKAGEERITMTTTLNSRQGALKAIKTKVQEIALALIGYEKDSTIWKTNNALLGKLESEAMALEHGIAALKSQIPTTEQNDLSIDQFLNLSKNASAKVKSGTAIEKDIICRLIFLNFSVDEEKVASYRLKEPFATLLGTDNFGKSLNGRGERT